MLKKNTYLKWFPESKNACHNVQVGSMKTKLHEITIRIYKLCLEHKIEFEIDWIPRKEIEQADF